ncbi:MAG: hypothetical protein E7631_00795 [Ruminococcaceae bacterium]|nr:hypothetical protein [Oscillospiraceae bacterium]
MIQKSKKYLLTTLISACLLLSPFLTTAAVTFGAPMQYDDTFLGELKEKHERLSTVKEDKIVLIGGSSLAFGMDSALLEEYTGMPVVNYGLYATLGTKAMLDMSRNHIGKGDIVVICPETDAQTYSLYYNAHSVWQALDSDISMFRDVGKSNFGKLMAALPDFAAEKLNFIRMDAKPAPSGIYAKDSFNAYGDIAVERKYNEMPTNYDPSMEISLTTALLDPDFIDYLNEFADHCVLRGADVYFSFPPMNAAAVTSDEEEQEAFYRTLGESLTFPVISDIRDYILPSAYFYDTNFHLNTRGALLRTALLADDLLRVMGVTERVETVKYTAPRRPADYFDLKLDGDENAKYFLYEEIDGGLAIVGLTDEGKTKTSLQIPRGQDNKAILMIGDHAFSDAAALEEIILGEYALVRSISVDAFAGCTALRRIELHLTPSELPVDSNVLTRLPQDCFIYIPQNMYGEFATDYFWSSMMKYVKTLDN